MTASRSRANFSGGEPASQSRAGSEAGLRSGRLGALLQATNLAPAASTSARVQASSMTRTRWPRASRRRATVSTGGTVPPPSQVASRKSRGITVLPDRGSWGVGRAGGIPDQAAREVAEDHGGGGRVQPHVAAEQLPGVDIGGDDERREPPLPYLRRQGVQPGCHDLGHPGAVPGAAVVEQRGQDRVPRLLRQQAYEQVARALVVAHQHPDCPLDGAGPDRALAPDLLAEL